MERKMYQPTEKQAQRWATLSAPAMPSDDEFKAMWKKAHHGKLAGWGMGKRDWIISNLKATREYQMNLWQGRVDAVQGLDYQSAEPTEEHMNAANLGYYRGYCEYRADGMKGWDLDSRQRFTAEYLNA